LKAPADLLAARTFTKNNHLGLARILRLTARPGAVPRPEEHQATRRLITLSKSLVAESGVSNSALATEALRAYEGLDEPSRLAFFEALLKEFSPSPDDVRVAAEAYHRDPSASNLRRLQQVVEPPRQELFRRLNMTPGGTRALVELRRQVLLELDAHPELEPISDDLCHLLASWFNSGFLTLERIDWRSPAAILEKLIAYEAVHQIQGWEDLRRRLAADRRCYAFFHSALPGEPLIFIEVALARGIIGSIQPLIDPNAPVGDPVQADSAIFYSITNCQRGLRGVAFGSSLIQQVVEDLRKSLPRIRNYATLSPIPGFRKWLKQELADPESAVNDEETRQAEAMLDHPERDDDAAKQTLLAVCAHYLLHGKRDNEALDAVARFHLKNGARLERINWMADMSPAGIAQSGGMMANYVYDPGDLQKNHEAYMRSGAVSASGRVERLARQTSKARSTSWLSRHFTF
jgi:malonyl-CoA decarboxylase